MISTVSRQVALLAFAFMPIAACVPALAPPPAAQSVTAEEAAVIARARSFLLQRRPHEPIPQIATAWKDNGEWNVRFEPPPPPPGRPILGGGWVTVIMTADALALVDILYGQ